MQASFCTRLIAAFVKKNIRLLVLSSKKTRSLVFSSKKHSFFRSLVKKPRSFVLSSKSLVLSSHNAKVQQQQLPIHTFPYVCRRYRTIMFNDVIRFIQKPQKPSRSMCRTCSPFTMEGIYFSLCASTQIKISTFHLRLLQSHHILCEQKPRLLSQSKKQACFT